MSFFIDRVCYFEECMNSRANKVLVTWQVGLFYLNTKATTISFRIYKAL